MPLITFLTFKHSLSFELFLKGNVRNRMLHAYMSLFRGLTCFKTCKTLSYKEIIVSEILPQFFDPKIVNIFIPISFNICLGAQKSLRIETVLLNTHSICFG